MEKSLQKKYIPMTETTYYTLLSVIQARHGYAIMQFVSRITEERIKLGTGTLYTMVGRLTADKLIAIVENESGKKTYQITELGMELLWLETSRLESQLKDGKQVLEEKTHG
ncbi:MAG: PadR family transcriptional regulator [Lachnospiraceae bacterium]|nr:PadR family transcriptional regulator [Lachnospiraceae bacterium]